MPIQSFHIKFSSDMFLYHKSVSSCEVTIMIAYPILMVKPLLTKNQSVFLYILSTYYLEQNMNDLDGKGRQNNDDDPRQDDRQAGHRCLDIPHLDGFSRPHGM